jgi:hypothetical protein
LCGVEGRDIFGSKMEEVRKGCIKLFNKELHGSYSSPDITRPSSNNANKMGVTCGTHGREEKCMQG